MLVSFILLATVSTAEPIKLWPDGNPGGWTRAEKESSTNNGGILRIANVSEPTLTYFPSTAGFGNETAVIICPGGGYNILAIEHEGTEIAEMLASRGYHAFVLKYRLPRKGDVRYEAALQDSQRAVEIVRSRAKEWGIASDEIVMMGFSAGGHLTAATAAANGVRTFEKYDARSEYDCSLDYIGLIYPAYLIDRQSGEVAPEIALTGEPVNTFLVQTTDDPIRVENSLGYYLHLKDKKGDAEMHIFPVGPHGYGLRATDKAVGGWPDLLLIWLSRIVLTKSAHRR